MTVTEKKILKTIAFQLSAAAASISALEQIAMSDNYSGRQITPQQLRKFTLAAKREQKPIFDALKASIQSLSAK
jgi:hypothetical protein